MLVIKRIRDADIIEFNYGDKIMDKPKEFYIDFEYWIIVAETEDEAIDKANQKIKNGELPRIEHVELAD